MKKLIYSFLSAALGAFLFFSLSYAQPSDKDAVREAVQYEEAESDDFKTTAGIRYKRNEDGTVEVETASIAYGKGAGFRKWKVVDTKLLIGNRSLRPESFGEIYSTQESIIAKPAVVVFTALGAAYGVYAEKCSTSGSSCAVGGAERGPIETTIDTAGMAAGLGLLTSQAKGEITGQKARFTLTRKEAESFKGMKLLVENTDTGRRERVKIPIGGIPPELSR